MGIFSRLSDVINSNIHAMLDKAEDPEKMVRLIIQEMEDTLVEVRSMAVRTLARRKELERTIARLQAEIDDWERKAELAVSKNREDLARAALGVRQRLAEQRASIEKELDHVTEELAKLDEDTHKLKAKLADARQRQKSIILRQQSVASRLKVKTQISDRKMADAMLRMEQYEGKIDRMEAELEAYDLGTRSITDEFARLESDDKIEAELAKLKARLGRSDAPGPDDKAGG
ncbi:phage shock protein A (PspA) family protein [Fontimonas thermophila]|uniref:Phage shock protein A (PspA) family protein n=1 Tax=Fontimonas thermophila TaxID=1076937 RepID=A0A1I2HVE7_9GAMM|nr:phage shock protein PspA [Fontimonas thermophila]SFF33350.1 phage shock protein A (PspA) family protein [Fontimonas thermophila]